MTPTSGEYTLKIGGSSGQLPPFQVAATNPAAGSLVNLPISSLTVDFNRGYLTTSVQSTDLLIDGSPTATDVTLVDGDTIRFSIPAITQGQHSFSFAAGSVQDWQGNQLVAFASTVTVDAVPPKVIATSLAPNGNAQPGDLSYQITFSEPMKVASLSSDDFSLRSNTASGNYSAAASFNAAGTVLTLNYSNLPEGTYTLTLVAGNTNGAT